MELMIDVKGTFDQSASLGLGEEKMRTMVTFCVINDNIHLVR